MQLGSGDEEIVVLKVTKIFIQYFHLFLCLIKENTWPPRDTLYKSKTGNKTTLFL